MTTRSSFGIISLLSSACICYAAIDQDYLDGQAALSKGNYSDAEAAFEKAYKKNPSDQVVKFYYATQAPASEALKLYKEISESQTAPDSIKAASLVRLGDYSYEKKEYAKAAERYRGASKLKNDPQYRHDWALASFANGDNETAKSLWYTLSLDYGDEISQQSQYYLGLLYMKQGNYEQAYNSFLKTGNDPDKPWTVPSTECKLECAQKLGMTEKAKAYEKLLATNKNSLVENKVSAETDEDHKAEAAPVKSVEDTSGKDSVSAYTLQVGAFGSMANASALKKRLTGKFNNVTIAQVTLADQVFYRVRIGTFSTKDSAETFGNDSLTRAGLSYRVVEK